MALGKGRETEVLVLSLEEQEVSVVSSEEVSLFVPIPLPTAKPRSRIYSQKVLTEMTGVQALTGREEEVGEGGLGSSCSKRSWRTGGTSAWFCPFRE